MYNVHVHVVCCEVLISLGHVDFEPDVAVFSVYFPHEIFLASY